MSAKKKPALKILAIIPARAGSKRLKAKNRLPLGHKPLISWTIQAAKRVKGIRHILVSTNCPKIARIAAEPGVLVPWLRPNLLAGDRATSASVALHALKWYEGNYGSVDGVLLLQPTSPFRTAKNISNAIRIFRKNQKRPVIGVTPAGTHPLQFLKMKRKSLRPFFEEGGLRKRHQDLETAYRINGAIYLVSGEHLKKTHSFFGAKNQPCYLKNEIEAIDIDTPFDYKIAQLVTNTKKTK